MQLRPTESWARYDEDPICSKDTSEHQPGVPQWTSQLKGDAAKGSTTASYFFKLLFPRDGSLEEARCALCGTGFKPQHPRHVPSGPGAV